MIDLNFGKVTTINKSTEISDIHPSRNAIIHTINFDSATSIKIITYYNNLDKKEKDRIVKIFNELNIFIRTDDSLGKLHFVILHMLIKTGDPEILIINDVGLSNNSLNFLKANFDHIMSYYKNKALIIYSNLIYNS